MQTFMGKTTHAARCLALAALAALSLVPMVQAQDYGDRGLDGREQHNFHRRGGERLFQAKVLDARAVIGTPERRCWIERGQVTQEQRRGGPSVPGAVVGAVIGGILGHQIGEGFGKDVATAGGVVAGAAVGAQVGRGEIVTTRGPDVQRCTEGPPNARPDYWDVTYRFRGRQHRMQMSNEPGRTITVNRQGEPRG
ncbi:MAG: glycine zipper 2TM domain-containing protein [Burkholderiales bacterium]|nr:glycine zipper 2TM domain-containing protein [Burkholderiales bacterium]